MRRRSDDEGAALMVALIFILVVGIMVTAALNKSGAVLKTDLAVRDTAQVQYAVDAGIDRALQVLRSDLANAAPSLCPSVGHDSASDFGDSGGLTVNGHIVHYHCSTTNGSIATPGASRNSNFAIITTKTGNDALIAKNGTGNPIPVQGSIYLSSTEDNNSTSGIKKEIDVTNADVVEYDQGDLTTCTTNLAALTKISIQTSGYNKVCGSQTPAEAVPQVQLTSLTSTLVDPPYVDYTTGSAKCRVFAPGTYTTSPALRDAQNGWANYFLSGEYYFYKSGGSLTMNVDSGHDMVVFAGQPNITTRADTTSTLAPFDNTSGCGFFAGKDSAAGRTATLAAVTPLFTAKSVTLDPASVWQHGVQWIMGQNAEVVVGKGHLALSSPEPDSYGSRSVSLVAARQDKWFSAGVTTDSSLGFQPWTTAGTALDSTASQADTVINGKVLAPDADIAFFGTQPGSDVVRGGIVARTLSIDASSAVSANQFEFFSDGVGTTNGPPPQRRTVMVTACVDTANPSADCTGSSASTVFTETAVATIDNFGTRPIRVYSWRTN